jgi:NAD(P)-dependent dehydrogenase (short-subunit alcohol dehydrogenase family)
VASRVGANSYGASKAAQWSLTNGIRLELAGQRTLVTGLVLSSADTDMIADLSADPEAIWPGLAA